MAGGGTAVLHRRFSLRRFADHSPVRKHISVASRNFHSPRLAIAPTDELDHRNDYRVVPSRGICSWGEGAYETQLDKQVLWSLVIVVVICLQPISQIMENLISEISQPTQRTLSRKYQSSPSKVLQQPNVSVNSLSPNCKMAAIRRRHGTGCQRRQEQIARPPDAAFDVP
jgi:hypothetical protein